MGNVRGWLWRGARVALFMAVAASAVYWIRFRPSPVVAHTLERGQIVAEVMGTGTLEARVETTISPKISGRIKEVIADQGDRVAAGDLLVQLDDDELRQQVGIAEANLEAATAAIERLKSDKDRAAAIFEQAQRSNERAQKLLGQNAASRDAADKANEALAIATADVARAEAAIREGQNELVAAERSLEYQRARLQDTRIVAPYDGLVVQRQRESGNVVVPGSSVLTLVSTKELWIRAWVDETEMARLDPGQPARVVFRSEVEKSYPGEVARLGKEADRETREFVVDVRVLELPRQWAVGQRAEAFIEIARKSDAVVMPAGFLSVRDGEEGVFVQEKGRAGWRAVKTGLRSREEVELREGVKAGETVVRPKEGGSALRDGQGVRIP